MIPELEKTYGVEKIIFESRQDTQNAEDRKMIEWFRKEGLISGVLRYIHSRPFGLGGDCLLWLPAVICGAVGVELWGEHRDKGEPCLRWTAPLRSYLSVMSADP